MKLSPNPLAIAPTVEPASQRPRWHWLDSLRVKLFVAIAGVNALVVLLAYLVHGWSFDQGLAAYLNRAEAARMAPLLEAFGRAYGERGSWQWMVDDHEAWHQLLRAQGMPVGDASVRGEGHGGMRRGDLDARSVREVGWTVGRAMLFDAQRVVLIGSPERAAEAVLLPIEWQGRVVGYLGRLTRRELVASLESAVSAQQGRQFAAVALGLLAAVLLSAAMIAAWLGRRLAVVGAGAAAVAQGDYEVRLPVRGHDELARLTSDFNHMATALSAAQRARQRWIADIAHELRTPLAGLRAEIEALVDGVRAPTAARFESLAQQVERLTRLVEDLRTLSLSDLGALDYRTEDLDLGALVADFFEHAPASLSGVTVDLDLASGLRVRADAVRLQQVLSNLMQNTARYCDAPARLRVRLKASGNGRHAVLRWEDSPPGVAPDDLPRLTERLFRVDASRARASGGSGLGLAIARAIVEGHGGRMVASASELGGLAWEIEWPLIGARTEAFHD